LLTPGGRRDSKIPIVFITIELGFISFEALTDREWAPNIDFTKCALTLITLISSGKRDSTTPSVFANPAVAATSFETLGEREGAPNADRASRELTTTRTVSRTSETACSSLARYLI
jgi:hypothetical protein